MRQKSKQVNLVHENATSGNTNVRRLKKMIKGFLYPKNPEHFSSGAMMLAARSFADYAKTGCTTEEEIDLMLFYVECGTQFTCDYGDIDEDFYLALETVFEDALKLIKKAGATVVALYAARLHAIVSVTSDMGWGYGDQIKELIDAEFPDFYQ